MCSYVAAALPALVYHLDVLNFTGNTGRMRPYADWVADVLHIATTPAWVTEGIFLEWTDAPLQAADRSLWLDLPWHIARYRIVRRYQASRRGTNQYPGLRRLLRSVRWSVAYYRCVSPAQIDALNEERPQSRAATVRHLGPYREKLTRC